MTNKEKVMVKIEPNHVIAELIEAVKRIEPPIGNNRKYQDLISRQAVISILRELTEV